MTNDNSQDKFPVRRKNKTIMYSHGIVTFFPLDDREIVFQKLSLVKLWFETLLCSVRIVKKIEKSNRNEKVMGSTDFSKVPETSRQDSTHSNYIFTLGINTSYLTDSYISFTLNFESGQKFCSNRSIRSSTYGRKNISDFPPCGKLVIFVNEFMIFLKTSK